MKLNALIHEEVSQLAPIDGVAIALNKFDVDGNNLPTVRVDFKEEATQAEVQAVEAYLASLNLIDKAAEAEKKAKIAELDKQISRSLVEVFDLLISKGVIVKGDISREIAAKIDERKAL